MHENMWLAAATQRNARQLEQDGAVLVGPVAGALASGEQGMGRMAEPEAIADAVEKLLAAKNDLAGRKVLISAGRTVEDIDPIRYITNRSSGRMGFALASAALERGAQVTLVCGPTTVKPPAGAEVIDVRSALEMHAAIMSRAERFDIVIMTAAVADYRAAEPAKNKIKKSQDRLTIELVKNPDILADLGSKRSGKKPVLIGFAMETTDLARYARKKLVDKRCDLIVGNEAEVGFGRDDTQVILVAPDGDTPLPPMSKTDVAHAILDRAITL
jgi:phosphopantothenoylcysteine decarboxylase/phosphopantothenate--cysteine ligase